MNRQKEPTRKELENRIRELTKTAKVKYKEFINSGDKLTGAVKTELESLRNVGILSERGNIVSNLRGKSKEYLQRQINELEYFNQWQGAETKALRDKTNYLKYQEFKNWSPTNSTDKPFENFTYQEWRNMVELMGTQSSLLESFGFDSQALLDLSNEMKQKKIKLTDEQLVGYMRVASKEAITTEDAVDTLRNLIGLNK